MSYRLGVDVGGTFTDLLLINEETGKTYTAKVPSTPEDSSIGVLNGVARICEESGVDPTKINRVIHGTTVAPNAVLQGKGAKVGLVTTEGYEQTLLSIAGSTDEFASMKQLGKEGRAVYDLFLQISQ